MTMTKEGIETTMTEEEIEKNKAPVEEKEGSEEKNSSEEKKPAEEKEDSEEKTELEKAAGAKAKVILTKVPTNNTHIATRLDEAIKGAKPVNRSSDLVPLGRDFDKMRKHLRSLIAGAKHYHAARVEVEKARMEVSTV
jgi:hypothetical protein